MIEYIGKVNVVRGNLMGLPQWARAILLLVATPGLIALALSILLVICSVAALLLVAVPVYGLLRMLTSPSQRATMTIETPSRRHVDVKIIE